MVAHPAICVLIFGIVGVAFCQTSDKPSTDPTQLLAAYNTALRKVRRDACMESVRKAIKEVLPFHNELHYSAGTKAYTNLNVINSKMVDKADSYWTEQSVFLYTYKRDIIFCNIEDAEKIRQITYEAVEAPYEPAHVIIKGGSNEETSRE